MTTPRQRAEMLRPVAVHGHKSPETTPGDPNVPRGFGSGPFLQSRLTEGEGDLTTPLTLLTHQEVSLSRANLSGANLSEANLRHSVLVKTNLTGATLTGYWIYGISAWSLNLKGAKQWNLNVSDVNEPAVMVDDLEVAQFIYLVMFSYAFFLKGFTGLAITTGSIVTLFVVMQVTGRIRWADKFALKPVEQPTAELT